MDALDARRLRLCAALVRPSDRNEGQPPEPVFALREGRPQGQAGVGQNLSDHYATRVSMRLGKDPMAVVDSRLRVRGIRGLRVIDASVMPTVTTGNTNATAVLIGEKGAAMTLEDCTGQPAD